MKLSYAYSLVALVLLACPGGTGTTVSTESDGSTGGSTGGTETTGTTTTTGITTSTETTPTTSGSTGGASTGQDLCAGVICQASDQCHELGECDPQTGMCSDPPRADGEPCDDGDACSTPDTCQAGMCVGGAAEAGGVDQSLLTSSASLYINAMDVPGQTFKIGKSGVLTGIELGAFGCMPLPRGGKIKLTLLDEVQNVLAEATAPIEGLPMDCVNYPLEADTVGPGLFDLSGSCLQVEVGEVFAFRLELVDVPAGVCELVGLKCSAGKVDEGCLQDSDCDFQVGVGLDFGAYADGELSLGDMPQMDQDLQFKAFVR
jgi:hypothetical protein